MQSAIAFVLGRLQFKLMASIFDFIAAFFCNDHGQCADPDWDIAR